jgi:hypothetical protein
MAPYSLCRALLSTRVVHFIGYRMPSGSFIFHNVRVRTFFFILSCHLWQIMLKTTIKTTMLADVLLFQFAYSQRRQLTCCVKRHIYTLIVFMKHLEQIDQGTFERFTHTHTPTYTPQAKGIHDFTNRSSHRLDVVLYWCIGSLYPLDEQKTLNF